MSAFPADDRRAATGQLRAVRAWLLDPRNAGRWYTLAELAPLASCSEASVSARLRDLRKEGWNVVRRRIPGLRVRGYRIDGRLPLEPAKRKPRDSELDALRARIERLEVELAALSTTTLGPGPRLRGTAGGGGAVRLSSEEGQ